MAKTVVGLFTLKDDAEMAIDRLRDENYDPKDISIVMRDEKEGEELAKSSGTMATEGAISGAAAGTVLGGIAGLVASFVIPGLGAFFVGGPIAAALGLTGAAAATASGAATGALAGGLLGVLTGLGLSEEDAQMYESRINEGGILLAVPAHPGEESNIEQILMDTNADDIKTISSRESDKTDEEDEAYIKGGYLSYDEPAYAAAGMKGGRTAKGKKVRSGQSGRRKRFSG